MKKITLASVLLAAAGLTASAADYTLPFYFEITQNQFDESTVINANNDGVTWQYYPSMDCIKYEYDSDNAANDWFITPAIDFGNTDKISLSLKGWTLGAMDDSMEVYLGTAPTAEAMTILLLEDKVTANSANKKVYTAEKEVTPGVYYLGIKATSPADQYGIYINDIHITSLHEAEPTPVDPVAYTLPYKIMPNDEQWAQCTVLDANGDGNPDDIYKGMWQLVNGNSMQYKYSSVNDADDWVFLPACDFGDVSKVTIALQAYASMPIYPESFQVYLGTAANPESMTKMVIEANEISNDSYETFSAIVDVTPGTYIVGVKATSKADRGDLFVRNISIEEYIAPEDIKYELPFYMLPTEAQFNASTVIDANVDSSTWKYDGDREAIVYGYNQKNNGDDWFITPEIDFGNSDKVRVSIDSWSATSSYTEAIAVYLGTAPTVEGMTIPVLSQDITSGNTQTLSADVDVTPGKYYLGIKATSPANMLRLYANNFRIESLHTVETGIQTVGIDSNLPVEYYNMNGVRIANPEKGSIVIARQGSKVVKMIVR